MTDLYQVKCTICRCWRPQDSGFFTDKLGRRNKSCTICSERRKRNQAPRAMCEHGTEKYACSSCGAGSRCEHGRARNRCVPCGGSGVCKHKRLRTRCWLCEMEVRKAWAIPLEPKPAPPIVVDWSEFADMLDELEL